MNIAPKEHSLVYTHCVSISPIAQYIQYGFGSYLYPYIIHQVHRTVLQCLRVLYSWSGPGRRPASRCVNTLILIPRLQRLNCFVALSTKHIRHLTPSILSRWLSLIDINKPEGTQFELHPVKLTKMMFSVYSWSIGELQPALDLSSHSLLKPGDYTTTYPNAINGTHHYPSPPHFSC